MKPIYITPTFNADALDAIEAELLALNWETQRTARKEYFMADQETNYSYGRRDDGITYTSKPWSELVGNNLKDVVSLLTFNAMIRSGEWKDVTSKYTSYFNACFLNKYDDQHQHLGWHADDFAGMDPAAPIAVMSFGAEREIWIKKKFEDCPSCDGYGFDGYSPFDSGEPQCEKCAGAGRVVPKGAVPPEDRYLLQRGSLFIMPPGFQEVMLHRIPKHPQPCGWRISLTFRKFL
jgi:alkylated DNA repair dioxygenase AlkB